MSDDGRYCTFGVEPGEYRIGAIRGNWNQTWLTGFYGNAERMEEAWTIRVGANRELQGIDFSIRQAARYSVKGKVLVDGSRMPRGLRIDVCNDWDYSPYWGRKADVAPDESFEITNIYAGRFRLLLTHSDKQSSETGAWWASIPEVLVPENATSAVIHLRRETAWDKIVRYTDVGYSYLLRQLGATRKIKTPR
ncbi:MAG TPA: hypothetical protein VE398_00780 [Acidobacteriota bacterium]|nr:hypothetical protein [Acidobacteriota bacterium]